MTHDEFERLLDKHSGQLRDQVRERIDERADDTNRRMDERADDTNRRIDEVNAHLRTLNGRVGAGEVRDAEMAVKLVNLEREVFKRRRRGDEDVEPLPPVPLRRDVDGLPDPGERMPITRRDAMLVIKTLGAAGAVVTFFKLILPSILKAVGP